jgi:hypothetical protein
VDRRSGKYLRRFPPSQALEIALLTPCRRPKMAKSMSPLMGVDLFDTGLSRASTEHLGNPRVGQPPFRSKPEPIQIDPLVLAALSVIAVEVSHRGPADRQPAGHPALSGDQKLTSASAEKDVLEA